MKSEESIRKANIFKGLKHHLNELKRLRPEYTCILISLQGSQNYNLDLNEQPNGDDEGYVSDVDSVAIVLPPFDNFVNNVKYISETIILDNNEHIDVKDIRQIFDLFVKQNIKYLEIINTPFRIIHPLYKNEVLTLFLNSNVISRANKEKLLTCIYGMSLEKMKALEHPYEGLKDKIEKYGYDGKQLHHIIRLYYFMERMIDYDFDFAYAMNFREIDSKVYFLLKNAKKSLFSLEEARKLANEYIDKITKLRADYTSKNDLVSDDEALIDFFNRKKSEIFEKYLREMFKPEEAKRKELPLPTPDKIWVTSDIHFGHSNILGFEPNRWKLTGTTEHDAIVQEIKNDGLTDEEISFMPDDLWDEYKKKASERYIEEHDKELIRRWNGNVHSDDVVFILGDLSFRNGEETNSLVKQLKGRKILVIGNHDRQLLKDKRFDTSLFEEVVSYKEIYIRDKLIVMFHFPIQVWNGKHHNAIHLYGHVHSNTTTSHPMEYDLRNSYNVGIDVNNYEPVRLDTYLRK